MWHDICIKEHSKVCSVLELYNFGEKSPTFSTDMPYGFSTDHASGIDDFKNKLRKVTSFHDKKYEGSRGNHSKKVSNVALVTAYTSSYQPMAEKYLAELGFNSTGAIGKLKHPDSKLTMWWMKATDFLTAIEYEDETKKPEVKKAERAA